MIPSDSTVVVCFRVKDRPVPEVAGATKDACFLCKEEVWISPVTKDVKTERKALTACAPCVLEYARANPGEVTDLHVDPRQVEEAADQIVQNRREDLEKN